MNNFAEGNNFYNTKDYSNALAYYKKAIANGENEACSYYNCGVCFIKLKDFDNAIIMIKSALSIQKESKYFFNLAYCYAMKEDTNKALIYFNMAWSLDYNDLDCEKAINLITSKNKKTS